MSDAQKPLDVGAGSSGGGLIGAIRRTSDAFANTIHLLGGGSQPNQPSHPSYAQQKEAVPASAAATAAEFQQKERRMSDIEHLYETSRKIDFEDF